MYYLVLSAFVPLQKHHEFEETCKLASFQMPDTCPVHDFYKNELARNEYYMISYWQTIESLNEYVKSPAYLMISGAFHTLGEHSSNVFGTVGISVHNES